LKAFKKHKAKKSDVIERYARDIPEGWWDHHVFKYGLALCALGMLQEAKRISQAKDNADGAQNDGSSADGDDLKAVSSYCNGIARVIVPVIRALYRGPQLGLA
jgi:hypothetical protein